MQSPSSSESSFCRHSSIKKKHEATFSKSCRLLHAEEFKHVFDKPLIKAQHPAMLILAAPNKHAHARMGLIVAKKNIKKAVRRNRFKRLVRESFRNQRKYLPAIDVIVLARSNADTLENDKLLSVLNNLWKRVNKNHAKRVCK